jgi:galactokinase/mevalonate kinase-like predicted kinase
LKPENQNTTKPTPAYYALNIQKNYILLREGGNSMYVAKEAENQKQTIKQTVYHHFQKAAEGKAELYDLDLSKFGIRLDERDWDIDIIKRRARKNIANPTIENLMASAIWNAINTRIRIHHYQQRLVATYHQFKR